MIRITILALAFCLYNPVFCQNHEESSPEVPHQKKAHNFMGVYVGNTIIAQSGFQLPTIGLEYVREVAPCMGIGLVTELEIGSHIVQKNEEGKVVSEVEREGAVLILPSVFVRVYKGLIFTVGYGVEIEMKENLALSKVGLEYKFRMHNPNWLILPGVSWDHTRLFDGVVYGVTFGYAF